jgi:hypothetical protein
MISANTLFHFTNSIDNIKNILTNNFLPRYCLERIDFFSKNTEEIDIGIPMVCFCDIPLSQITEHINTYGEYAIGLSKDWAIKKGISPVFYIHKKSSTCILLNGLWSSAIRNDAIKAELKKNQNIILNNDNSFATMDAMGIIFYLKKHIGDMWRNNTLKRNILFYNEREWRYVPELNKLTKLNPRLIINKEEYDNEEKRIIENRKIASLYLPFIPNDIKYIIVNKETERIDMARAIDTIKGSMFTLDDLTVLKSKIISVEQIRDDF